MGKLTIGSSISSTEQSTETLQLQSSSIVEKEVIVEKIVEVPVEVIKEVIVEKTIEVPVEKIVEKKVKEIIYVDKPIQVIKEIEKVVEVPVEVIKEVQTEVFIDKIVSVPVEVIKEVQVIKKIVPKWAMMIAAVEFAIIILLIISRS